MSADTELALCFGRGQCAETSYLKTERSLRFTLIAETLFTAIITATVFVSHFYSFFYLITVGAVSVKDIIVIDDTGWTNVNLLYLPDSIEIASLEGLTLWCPESNQSKRTVAW